MKSPDWSFDDQRRFRAGLNNDYSTSNFDFTSHGIKHTCISYGFACVIFGDFCSRLEQIFMICKIDGKLLHIVCTQRRFRLNGLNSNQAPDGSFITPYRKMFVCLWVFVGVLCLVLCCLWVIVGDRVCFVCLVQCCSRMCVARCK